jgi:hypothetical protein
VARDIAWQPSLLDGGEPRIDVSYDGLRRIELDARSWVDYCPGWLAGSDSVFEVLAREARWQQRTVTMWDKQVLEPRLTAGWSTAATHVPPLLAEICALLAACSGLRQRLGEPLPRWTGQRCLARGSQPAGDG